MFAAKNELLTTPSGGYRIPRSLRFRSSASAYLNRTFGTATDTKKYTFSFWTKRGALGGAGGNILVGGSGTTYGFGFNGTGTFGGTADYIYFTSSNGGATVKVGSNNLYRDASAFYHIVLSVDTTQSTASNRVKIYVNGVEVSYQFTTYPALNADTGVNTATSHVCGAWSAGTSVNYDGYLAEVNFIDGQALTPSSFGAYDTNGVWQPIAYTGTYGTNGFYLPFSDNSALSPFGGTALSTNTYSAGGFGNSTVVNTVQSIPNNTVITYAGQYSNSAESNKYIYVVRDNGGGSFTLMATSTIFNHPGTGLYLTPLSYTVPATGTYYLASLQTVGGLTWGHDGTGTQYYITVPISGTQSYTTLGGYGSPSLVWLTSTPTGLTKDASGLGNHWQPAGISLTSGTTYDSMIDSPTNYADGGNGRGNYATVNPLQTIRQNSGTYTNGNLTVTGQTGGSVCYGLSTIGVTSGKWYFEATVTSNGGYGELYFGIFDPIANGFIGGFLEAGTGAPTYTSYGTYACAFDADAGKIWFRNSSGTWVSGDPAAGTSPSYTFTGGSVVCYPVVAAARSSGNNNPGICDASYGQRPFTYAPPSSFSALNTQNLPAPALTPSP